MKKLNIKILILSGLALVAILFPSASYSGAASCKDLYIIFARGSGESANSQNYQAFKDALGNNIEQYLPNISYQFSELQYPASSIGSDNLRHIATAAGAIFSGGESYAFGASVNQGVSELKSYIKNTSIACPTAHFALGGYSQGAMVLSKAIREGLDPSKIIYIATFGDPKLYLPEGSQPAKVCRGEAQLSPYRIYVPDCRAFQGILGGYEPYLPYHRWEGKLGTWCNYHDIMCSSKINFANLFAAHEAYVSDHRYEDAALVITAKLAEHFTHQTIATTTNPSSNVAFLVDTSATTPELLTKYIDEITGLAKVVVANGGRVALYETSHLGTRQLCSFVTCSPSDFPRLTASLAPSLGQASLYDSVMHTMNELSWTIGANKQVIAFTNAGVVPGSVTFSQLVARSREIDPVHISIVVPAAVSAEDSSFSELAAATSGDVYETYSDSDKLYSHLSNLYSEGTVFYDPTFTEVKIENLEHTLASKNLTLSFTTNAPQVLILVNDFIYGFTSEKKLTITNLDLTLANKISLIPYSEDGYRGEIVHLELAPSSVPLAPDSGIKLK